MSGSDRRAKQLVLTDEGTEQRQRVLKALADEPIFTGLSQEQLDTLGNLLQLAVTAR
ncbi:MAG TPA: hypothetical protein VFN97_20130 [Actinospica sp.]|nr:hypothetical protein [Actinospica sp.]